MKNVEFYPMTVREFRDKASAIMETHWREISAYDDIELAPNWALYEALERAGTLRAYGARCDGLLVGYAIFFVAAHPHYAGSLQATEDILYVHPEYRRGRVGIELVRYTERELKRLGVQVVHHHVKVAHPALGKVLEHLGYNMVETIYSKRLDK